MKKVIFCITVILTACSSEVKNTAFIEDPKQVADTISCKALVVNDTIIGDTNLIFPRVKLPDSTVAEKINRHLTVQMLSYYTLDELKEYKENFKKDSILFGLTAAGYEITHNENCLLSLIINMETMGAYPSGFSMYRNFDLSTGDSVYLEKMLDGTQVKSLVKLCDDSLQQRIVNREKIPADEDFNIDELLKVSFKKENLRDFYVTNTDVIFFFDFGFPHAIQGTEPDGFIKIKREEFRKYLKVNPYKI